MEQVRDFGSEGWQVEEYVDVPERAQELGCRVPSGLALLPTNFETVATKRELAHDLQGLTVRALWREAGLEESRLEEPEEQWPTAQKDAFEWLGPTIFVSASLLSEDPNAVSVALGVVANYVTDFFKGVPRGQRRASLDVVVEDPPGSYRRVRYRGPPEGLQEAAQVVRELRQ